MKVFQRASHEIYFDARIIEVDKTAKDGKFYRIRYDSSGEAGETEWLHASELFLSFPSETLTVESARAILAPPNSSMDADYLTCWLQTQAVPDSVREAINNAMKRNAGIVERILFWRQSCQSPPSSEYRVKWFGCSYRLCQYVPRKLLELVAFSKLLHFERKYSISPPEEEHNSFPAIMDDEESDVEFYEGIRADWITVDRVISIDATNGRVYVKWRGLGYKEATWEDISALTADDHLEIDRFRNRVQIYRARAREQERRVRRRGDRGAKKGLPVVNDETLRFDTQPGYLKGGNLYDYQLEGLNWMLHKRSEGTNVILADEMGLGKTIQIAALVGTLLKEESMDIRPFLIVVPLSTLRNWKREFQNWCPHVNFVEYFGSFDDRKIMRRTEFDPDDTGQHMFDVLCTSYEIAVQDRCHLSKIGWEGMIIDEAHRLKGGTQSKLFDTLCTFKAKQKILVTGTPLQNNLEELFNLIKFLNNSSNRPTENSVTSTTFEQFSQSHLDSNSDEKIESLKTLLRPYVLRRLKKDQLINLAPRVERLIPLRLSALQKEYYAAILTRNYKVLNGEDKTNRKFSLLNILMELRKCCIHPYLFDNVIPKHNDENCDLSILIQASSKLQFLDLILPRLKEDGHRVLIFSQFTRMLDILETFLEGKEHSYLRIDGTVHGEDRQQRIDLFNDPQSSVFVFLLSTRAGGLGINLTAADTVVIFDSDFNPHRDIQALSRAHRIGQQRKVLILRLVCKGTVEEGILKAARAKLALESVVVNSLTNSHRSLSKEDLEQIVSLGAEEICGAATDSSSLGTCGHEIHPQASSDAAAAADRTTLLEGDTDPSDGQTQPESKSLLGKGAVSIDHTSSMADAVQVEEKRADLFSTEDIVRMLAR